MNNGKGSLVVGVVVYNTLIYYENSGDNINFYLYLM